MKTNKKLFSRVLAMVLCAVMLLGSTGLAPAFAVDGTIDGDTDTILADGAAQSPVDGVDGTNGNGDDTIVPDGNGDDAAVPDIDADNNAGNDLVPGDNEIIPDPEPDPDLEWQAALEALQAAYDAFVAEIDAERRYHEDDIDHSCLYPDFDAFLARYEAAVTTGMDLSSEEAYQALMTRFEALLSEAAVSAYLVRGEMILVSDYDGMPGFDSDVGRMEGLKRYILDANAVTDMDNRIELARQALAEKLENGSDPENPENPGDPENPDDPENPAEPEDLAVPETVTAVLDYYDAFCARLPNMTFDQVLVELDVLTGLIRNVMPEDRNESVDLIEGYLPEIRSQQAMAEFVRRVNAIREQAAAGKYDVNHPDFDRAAAQAEFDAVRDLSQYMLDAELASENYANGLKILSNLEELMDAEPEPELSEQAVAFLDSVNRLQEEMQTEYAGRPYSAIKAVDKLLTECSGLSATDLLDENVQAAKIALENMKRRIVIKPEILAFLQNVDILLSSVNNGADLESEEVTQQAAAVVESMGALTEADMENVEVAESYQKLVEAGLVPEDAVNYAVMAISGVVTCDGVPFEGADIAIFKYSDGVYTRVTETKQFVAIDILKTSSDGAYGVNDIWPNDYYVAVRGVHGVQPATDSALVKVTDDMEGLAGWLYVHAVSGTLGSVVCDISFISDVPPVSMMTGVYEQANSSGFVSGQSGFMPYDEIDDEYASAWAEDPSFVGELSNKGDPIATLGVGEKGYIAADIRVTSEFGASNISFSLSDFNGVSADLIPDDPKFGVSGVYELDASGRPIRALDESEYEILALGDYRGNPVICIHDQDLLSYGKAYRIIWSFYSFWHYNGFTTEGSGAAVNGIFCYCVYGDDHHLPDPSIECDYVTDVAEYMQSGVLVDLTDMDGVRLPGAKFKLYYDEACTRQASLIAGDPNATFDNIVCVCEDTTHVPNYTVNPSVRHDDVEVPIDDVIQINGLKSGTYYLKQTVFPDGYEAEDGGSGVTKICVNNDNGVLCEQYQYVIKNRIKLPPYEVNITWLDGMAGATLSGDKTHADFVVSAENGVVGIGDSMRLDVLFNASVPAGTDILTVPYLLATIPISDKYGLDVDVSGISYEIRYSGNFTSAISKVQGLRTAISVAGDCVIRTTDEFQAGTKLSVPLRLFAFGDWSGRVGKAVFSFPVDFDGMQTYTFYDGLGNDHMLTFSRFARLETFDIDKSGRSSSLVTQNVHARVFSWQPAIEKNYGVTKEQFEALTNDGQGLFEYGFLVHQQSATLAHIDFDVDVKDGLVQGVAVLSTYSRNPSKSMVHLVDDWRVEQTSNDRFTVIPANGGFRGPYAEHELMYARRWCGNTDDTIDLYSITRNVGFFVYILASHPLDVVTDQDAGKTLTECTLLGDYIADYSGEIISDAHTLSVFEPMTYFPSDGDMYELHVKCGTTNNNRGLAPLLLGGEIRSFSPVASGTWKFVDGSDPDTISLTIDHVALSNGQSSQYSSLSLLGPGDYNISSIHVDLRAGDAYFSDDGLLQDVVTDPSLYDDELEIYVCRADSPDIWTLDGTTRIKNIVSGSGGLYTLHCDDAIRVRVDYPGRRSFVSMNVVAYTRIKSDGPSVLNMIQTIIDEHKKNPNSSSTYPISCYGSLLCWDESGPKAAFSDTYPAAGMLADALNASAQVLYANMYGSGVYPLRDGSSSTCLYLSGADTYAFMYSYASETDQSTGKPSEIATYIVSGLGGHGLTLGELYNADQLSLTDAEFYVRVPDNVEIVDVFPGYTGKTWHTYVGTTAVDTTYAGVFLSTSGNGGASIVVDSDYITPPEIEYDFVNFNGQTMLHVISHSTYDRQRLLSLFGDDLHMEFKVDHEYDFASALQFGGFTVVTRPKYTPYFMSSADSYIAYISQILTETGDTYYGDLIWRFYADEFSFSSGDPYLYDVNRNGDRSDRCAMYRYSQMSIKDGDTYISGLQLAAQGSDNQFWNKSVTTHTGDPYAYRLTYSQMAETSKNVVLFDSLEDLPGNTWTGHLDSIDLSDAKAKNLSVKVYRNDKNIDSVKYVQDNITGEQLAAGYDGWTLLTECMPDDPNSYSISGDLSAVKSVAFDFGDQEFAKDQAGKPNAVQVYLRMSAPVSGFGNGSNPVQNRAFYSDVLIGSGKARSVMANTVTVDLDTTVSYTMDKTIGAYWPEDLVDMSGWTFTSDPENSRAARKLTLDKSENKPDQDFMYHYTMRYAQARPAVGRYEKIHDVVLYDEIEMGSDSRYAGRLAEINITGQTWYENLVTPLSVIGWEQHDAGYTLVGSEDMSDCCDVYISYPDVVPSANLPDALVETTGRSDWELFVTGAVPDDLGQKITAVAVYIPEMIAKAEADDDPVQDSFIEVNLNMVHAGKPGNKGVDKILRNGFTVGFTPNGSTERIVDSRPDQTELEIIYKDTGVVLPVTGGPGVAAVYAAGMLFLVPAAITITRRTRRRQAR